MISSIRQTNRLSPFVEASLLWTALWLSLSEIILGMNQQLCGKDSWPLYVLIPLYVFINRFILYVQGPVITAHIHYKKMKWIHQNFKSKGVDT